LGAQRKIRNAYKIDLLPQIEEKKRTGIGAHPPWRGVRISADYEG
jgi:hypothetical protein